MQSRANYVTEFNRTHTGDNSGAIRPRHGYITTPSAVGTAWERDLHGGADMASLPYTTQGVQ